MSSLDNRKTLALENKIFSFKDGISYSDFVRVFWGWKVMLPNKTLMSAETGSFHISAKRATRQDFSQSRERDLNCGYGESTTAPRKKR